MAASAHSLRRRNRWAAFAAASVLATTGTVYLHLSFLRLQREQQADVVRDGAKALSQRGELALTAEAERVLPLDLLWAVGPSPSAPLAGHADFRRLAAALPWPSPGAEPASVRLPDGRAFLLLVQESQPGGRGRIYLALETTRDELLASRILTQRILTVALIALTSLILADLIFREAMRPLKNLALKAATIRPKDLGQRLNLEEFPLELHDLVASLNVTLERLQDAFQRMEHLSTDLAHELRSPIQNIRSEIEGLLLHPPAESERTESLGSALEEMDRLAAMIEQMLFLARCEDPGSELRLGPIPVPNLLQEIADYFEASAETADVALRVEAEPIAVLADRSLVQRALGNLVSNALRHTPAGGSITLRARQDGTRLLLEVIDTGEGIPNDVLPRLGTRFTRVEDSRSRSTGGSGLGLAIVQGIMRLHGGTLEVESVMGRGTTARLCFRMDPTGRSRNGVKR